MKSLKFMESMFDPTNAGHGNVAGLLISITIFQISIQSTAHLTSITSEVDIKPPYIYGLNYLTLVWQHHSCPTNAKVFNVLMGFALRPFFGKGKMRPSMPVTFTFHWHPGKGIIPKLSGSFSGLSWTTIYLWHVLKANFPGLTFQTGT